MIRVQISERMRLFAKEKTEEILKEFERPDNNQTPLFNTNPYENRFMGFLGEAIFKTWLYENQINYSYKGEVMHNRGDDYDFLINEKKWDVKTNRKHNRGHTLPNNYDILLHPSQLKKHADYYFWIMVEGNPLTAETAYLMGGMNADKVSSYPIKEKIEGVLAITIPPEDLLPCDICLDILGGA